MARRADSDEHYVIDLLDDILGEKASRGHRFEWLLGDPSARGARVRLPVDAYWPGHGLVVEYREDQHYIPNSFMDRRETVSGVHRGEQRRRYDQRRDELVPANGLTLLVIRPHDLRVARRDRLARDVEHDRAALGRLLRAAMASE